VKLTCLHRDEDIAEVQLAHLQNILESLGLFYFQNLPLCVRVELSATLLAASTFALGGWKERAVHLAKNIIDDLPICYLHPWMARRQASLSSCPEDMDQEKPRGPVEETDIRFHAQHGRLIAFRSEQFIRHGRIDLAHAKLQQWKPRSALHSPKLERMAHFRYKLALAKVLRFKGDLEASLSIFSCLSHDDIYDSTSHWQKCRLASHMADVLCELGHPRQAITILLQLLRGPKLPNNDLLEALNVSLGEAFAQEGMSEPARTRLLAIKNNYDKVVPRLSEMGEMTHVRACIGLARISHGNGDWQSAFTDWHEASRVVQRYNWGGDFTYGIVQYCLSHVIAKLQRYDVSKILRETSEQILSQEGQQDWMPLVLGTKWFWFAKRNLEYNSNIAFVHEWQMPRIIQT
jgi:hypothetical protein